MIRQDGLIDSGALGTHRTILRCVVKRSRPFYDASLIGLGRFCGLDGARSFSGCLCGTTSASRGMGSSAEATENSFSVGVNGVRPERPAGQIGAQPEINESPSEALWGVSATPLTQGRHPESPHRLCLPTQSPRTSVPAMSAARARSPLKSAQGRGLRLRTSRTRVTPWNGGLDTQANEADHSRHAAVPHQPNYLDLEYGCLGEEFPGFVDFLAVMGDPQDTRLPNNARLVRAWLGWGGYPSPQRTANDKHAHDMGFTRPKLA